MDLSGVKDFFGNVKSTAVELQNATISIAKNVADTKAALSVIKSQPVDAAQVQHSIWVATQQNGAPGSVGAVGQTAANAVNRLLSGESGGWIVLAGLGLVGYLLVRRL